MKLPDHLAAQLEAEAKARRVTKSRLLRDSLAKTLGKPAASRSCFDLASDLAGSLRGLPKDLADNPKYMDGFGE